MASVASTESTNKKYGTKVMEDVVVEDLGTSQCGPRNNSSTCRDGTRWRRPTMAMWSPRRGAPSLMLRPGTATPPSCAERIGRHRQQRSQKKREKKRWAWTAKQMEPTPPLVFDVATGRVGTSGSAVRRLAEQPQGWVGDQSPRLAARNSWKQCRDMGRGTHPTSFLGPLFDDGWKPIP